MYEHILCLHCVHCMLYITCILCTYCTCHQTACKPIWLDILSDGVIDIDLCRTSLAPDSKAEYYIFKMNTKPINT